MATAEPRYSAISARTPPMKMCNSTRPAHRPAPTDPADASSYSRSRSRLLPGPDVRRRDQADATGELKALLKARILLRQWTVEEQ